MVEIKLRESEPFGEVIVMIDGVEKYRSGEYMLAVRWLEARHPQAWAAQNRQAARDYKDDYDARCEEED